MGKTDRRYLLASFVKLNDGYGGGALRIGKCGHGTDKVEIVVAVSKEENGVPLFASKKVVKNV